MAETLHKTRLRNAFLSTAEEIVDEARNGRMFILVDDEDRENEGDLVIPAQMATPEAINFMARHGRGLICLALTKERVETLGLTPMTRANGNRHETAFTISIEARQGVSTGISAADRARTIAVAIDATNGADALVSPGHVFPLIARPGGVLVRTGHTEAAVDVARLAGLNPSGVICEIMKDDGTMARLEDLVDFAKLHRMKIGTIRDLVAFRRHHDHNVQKASELRFNSRYGGLWNAITYHNSAVGSETLALVKGQIDPSSPTLVRMHTFGFLPDALGEIGDRFGLLEASMRLIAEEGSGIIVIINRQLPNSISTIHKARKEGMPASPEVVNELRDYGIGAQILTELGVENMILLTNSHQTLVALDGYGLTVVEERKIQRRDAPVNENLD